MVATFSETSAVASKKYVVKQGMNNLKSFKNYKLIWSHPSFLLYTKSLKNVNFRGFF